MNWNELILSLVKLLSWNIFLSSSDFIKSTRSFWGSGMRNHPYFWEFISYLLMRAIKLLGRHNGCWSILSKLAIKFFAIFFSFTCFLLFYVFFYVYFSNIYEPNPQHRDRPRWNWIRTLVLTPLRVLFHKLFNAGLRCEFILTFFLSIIYK